jgi:hypothetical protein
MIDSPKAQLNMKIVGGKRVQMRAFNGLTERMCYQQAWRRIVWYDLESSWGLWWGGGHRWHWLWIALLWRVKGSKRGSRGVDSVGLYLWGGACSHLFNLTLRPRSRTRRAPPQTYNDSPSHTLVNNLRIVAHFPTITSRMSLPSILVCHCYSWIHTENDAWWWPYHMLSKYSLQMT